MADRLLSVAGWLLGIPARAPRDGERWQRAGLASTLTTFSGFALSFGAGALFAWGVLRRTPRAIAVSHDGSTSHGAGKNSVKGDRKRRRQLKAKGENSQLPHPGANEVGGGEVAIVEPAAELMKLGHLNLFLRWDCSHVLLSMGLFPNAQEITESMACLNAMEKHLPMLRFSEPDTLCLVVGDGVSPRTAALIAMRTKWRRVVSIDPVLNQVNVGEEARTWKGAARAHADYGRKLDGGVAAAVAAPDEVPAAAHDKRSRRVAERERQREQLLRVERLELLALPVERAVIDVKRCDRHVVILLPHAHVVPDLSLGALRFDMDPGLETTSSAQTDGPLPSISVVQLPCCSYVKHDTVCSSPPDVTYLDERICCAKHGKREVRVWKDVAGQAVALRAVRLGERPPLSDRLLSARWKFKKKGAV